MRASALTLEYVKVPTTVTINGAPYDPHLDAVQLAFPAHGVAPAGPDFKVGSWEQDQFGTWMARCLVGPGGAVSLVAGTYDVWVKITDSPEVPVRKVGILEVF